MTGLPPAGAGDDGAITQPDWATSAPHVVVEWNRICPTMAPDGTPGTPVTLTERIKVPGAAADKGEGGVQEARMDGSWLEPVAGVVEDADELQAVKTTANTVVTSGPEVRRVLRTTCPLSPLATIPAHSGPVRNSTLPRRPCR
jgi:hypothetical protein